MLCPKCGRTMPDENLFCTECGGRMSAGVAQSIPAYAARPCARQKYPKRKNGSHAALIAVFCGVIMIAAVLGVLVLFKAFPPDPANDPRMPPGAEASAMPSRTNTAAPSYAPSKTPRPVPSPTRTAEPAPKPTPVPVEYDEVIPYFCEIALYSEYGGGSTNGIVKRWEEPIKVEIRGGYTKQDYDFLLDHIDALNAMGCIPSIAVVKSGGNYIVSFVPLKKIPRVVPGYVEGNWGFFCINWDDRYKIHEVHVGIATDVTNQLQRNHLILEEFTQGLGLLNDSPRFTDSIFQAEWTEIQELSKLDYQLIAMLYNPLLEPGMAEDKAVEALTKWLYTVE